MSIEDYKSSFHYLVLQLGHSGLSCEEFLLYFSNKDIGKLDLAISETVLRDSFYKRLGSFYNNNEMTCFGELRMIAKGGPSIDRCQAPNVSIGDSFFIIDDVFKLILSLLQATRRARIYSSNC